MKRNSTKIAALVFSAGVLAGLGSVGEAVARDHYRIGTLNESVHYRDNEEFNSSHDGLYLVHNRNIYGTYYNSEYEQSLFYARTNRINSTFSYSYGVAFGYDLGVMPMVGLSAQMNVFKLTLTQQAAVIGLEFPLF